MGKLFYGNAAEGMVIPDDVLAHLKIVTTTKLRRNESFTVSWRSDADGTPGRTTIWMQSAIPLRFAFDGVEPETLDPARLRVMSERASSSGGLTLDIEPAATAPASATPVAMAGVAA
ncbi:hypothetical protein AB0N73_03845 [Microbacterium sp. NPDC089189]|uniref:DUF7882 family protein n=1 Tax=Microbacterium sp. NPDC089189 TaxID=3154972 RepID=UPI00341D7B8E